MSFSALTTQMTAIIQASTAVSTLVTTLWPGKTLTVKTGIKSRQEINVTDLPIALIVRPERKLTSIVAKQYDHSFILFVGIHCDDRETAPGMLDALENAVEDALIANYNLGGTAVDCNFIASANDMGIYHPQYFTTMQFDVSARK